MENSGPVPTKYTPSFSYVHSPIAKNVEFGEKTEVENRIKLNAIYEKIKPPTICTKGGDQCFGSIKRVK